MSKSDKRLVSPYNEALKLKGFNAFKIEEDSNATKVYSRKDFYKICLTTGKSVIHYADRSFDMDGTILFFGNPKIPYSWETLSTTYVGYTCLFSEDFIHKSERTESLQNSPFFKYGGTPILHISEEQRSFLNGIFNKMIEEQKSDYVYKDDLMRNYINLIIHEALKMNPSENYDTNKDAAHRIANVFIELLERQFPVETPDKPLSLKSATEFANTMGVHVNHLNRSLKQVMGQTTTSLINERIISEAKAILQHTTWTVADIAFALGFDYPTYFNNFFKRNTGITPTHYRLQKV